MKIYKNILFTLLALSILNSCSGLNLQKKSSSGEEFLIDKKDPLILPPEFSKLPKPNEEIKQNENIEEELDLNKVFKGENINENTKDDDYKSGTGIENKILEKIKNNNEN